MLKQTIQPPKYEYSVIISQPVLLFLLNEESVCEAMFIKQ